MKRLMYMCFLLDMFHDINFASVGPAIINRFLRHHPYGWKCAVGVLAYPCSDFDFTKGKVKFPLRLDTSGAVGISNFSTG